MLCTISGYVSFQDGYSVVPTNIYTYCITANIIHFKNRFTRWVLRPVSCVLRPVSVSCDADVVAAVYEFIVCAAFSHKYLQSACKKQKVARNPGTDTVLMMAKNAGMRKWKGCGSGVEMEARGSQ